MVMSAQSAFQRGVSPLLQLLLSGREEAVLSVQTDQSLRELTQAPVAEYAQSASPAEIDAEESILIQWAERNHRLFPADEIQKFEKSAPPKGGGSEHDAWKIETPNGAFVIRRTINDSYGFRFSSPFQYFYATPISAANSKANYHAPNNSRTSYAWKWRVENESKLQTDEFAQD